MMLPSANQSAPPPMRFRRIANCLATAALCALGVATGSLRALAQAPASPAQPGQGASPVSPAPPTPVVLPNPLPEVQILLNKAEAALKASKTGDAETLYTQVLALARAKADRVSEAQALIEVGQLYDRTGRPSDALTALQQALALYRGAGNKRNEAAALDNIGNVYNGTGRPKEALTALQQALSIFRSIGDKDAEGRVLLNIGQVDAKTGRHSDALTAFQQAVSLFQSTGDKNGEAYGRMNIGLVYDITGRTSGALSAFQQLLPLFQDAGDKDGEANLRMNIGLVYVETGRPADALAAYQQALSLFRGAEDKGGEESVLANIGNVYLDMGRSSDALTAFQQALLQFQRAGDKNSEAKTRLFIGIVYDATGRLSDALASYQQGLTLSRATGAKDGEAAALGEIAGIYDKTGRPMDAAASYRQALLLLRSAGDKHGEAVALNNMGEAYSAAGHFSDALTAFHSALPFFHGIGDKDHEAMLLASIAVVQKKQGHSAAALESYARAIDLVEQIRSNLGGYTASKQSYLTVRRDMYTGYLDCLLTAPDASATHSTTAFALSEQTKARSLLDLLDSGQVDLNAALSDDDKAQLRDLRQQSDALNTQMVQEGVENNVGAKARFAAIQQQQRDVEGKLQRLTDTLYAKHPDLAEKRAATTATAADLAPLLDKDTAVLEYVQTIDNKLALFVVTQGSAAEKSPHVTTHYLTVRASLAADCAAFQTACADPRKDYATLAAKLYTTLVAPAATELAGKTRLIVCPDGPLWNVPFQALTDKNGKFLADHEEIDYAYSATGALAAYNARQRQKSQQAAAGEGSLLVLANPSFGDAKRFGDLDDLPGQRPMDRPSRPMERPSRPMEAPSRPIEAPSRPIEAPSRAMAETLARGGRIAPLPGTQREADALKALFPDATVLTGENAQEETVKKDAPNYRYLHLATHGFFNDAAPMLSSLVLAQPDAADKAAGDNGFLTARDIFDLRLPNTELVTLSACNTGRGAIQSGEGVVGLTWALFAAGCPTQVVSQWSVDDAATATLMTRFYTELKAGTPKGVALHDAARSLAHDPAHRHPYYWAPFVLFGDWN